MLKRAKTTDQLLSELLNERERVVRLQEKVLELAGELMNARKLLGDESHRARQAEEALKAGQLALWDWNIPTGEIAFSDSGAQMLGYAPGDINGRFTSWRDLVHPDDLAAIRHAFDKHVLGQTSTYESEHRLQHKSGKWIWNLARGKVVEWDKFGNPLRMIGINYDVTERKIGEERLKSSLQEKEVMLQEIHHRVKNNLAVVSSLVSLQSEYASDDRHKQMFEDTQNRIRSMALAHEMLYQTDNLAELSISEYLGNLIDHLAASVATVATDVTFTTNIEDIGFTLDTIIPLGSMVTELVSNSLKHAFPNGRPGTITVSVRTLDRRAFELIVADDGVGMPCSTDVSKPKSLGLDLIRIFVRQIHGEMESFCENGTRVRITFQDARARKTGARKCRAD